MKRRQPSRSDASRTGTDTGNDEDDPFASRKRPKKGGTIDAEVFDDSEDEDGLNADDSDDDGDFDAAEEGQDNGVEKKKFSELDREKLHAKRLQDQGIDADQEGAFGKGRVLTKEAKEAFSKKNMGGMEKFSMSGYWDDKTGAYVDDRRNRNEGGNDANAAGRGADDYDDDDDDDDDPDPWFSEWKEKQKQSDHKGGSKKRDDKKTSVSTTQKDGKEKSGRQLLPRLELLKMLVKHLETRETVLKAIKRLGGTRTRSKQQLQKQRMQQKRRYYGKDKKKQEEFEAAKKKQAEEDAKKHGQTAEEKAAFEELTSAADELLARGDFNVYQHTKERFELEVDREEEKIEKMRNQWEYRWTEDEKNQTFGPYSASQMQQWHQEGFFAKALVRRSGTTEWLSPASMSFS